MEFKHKQFQNNLSFVSKIPIVGVAKSLRLFVHVLCCRSRIIGVFYIGHKSYNAPLFKNIKVFTFLNILLSSWLLITVYNFTQVVTVEGSKITKFDLSADNGMVHVIDKVMMPPSGSIVDIVAGDSDFSTLLKQVQSAGLASALQGNTAI